MGKSKRIAKLIKDQKEFSAQFYNNLPALNWGESRDGNHVFVDKYSFNWEKSQGTNKNLVPIKEDLYEYIKRFKEENEMAGRAVNVAIGTDSQDYVTKTKFITVICIQVERNGVHVLVSRQELPRIYDVKYRLLKETDITAEFVRNNQDFFNDMGIPFVIHGDYNRDKKWKSNSIVVEATNYIKFLGYDLVIKENSFAATFAADHFC